MGPISVKGAWKSNKNAYHEESKVYVFHSFSRVFKRVREESCEVYSGQWKTIITKDTPRANFSQQSLLGLPLATRPFMDLRHDKLSYNQSIDMIASRHGSRTDIHSDKLTWQWNNVPIEDAFPLENGNCPLP